MNRRLKQSGDSTEMLLDTVCNFFGGIVLIALLIALTSSSDSQDDKTDEEKAINETINRKLDQSEADLAALGAFKDKFDQAALLFANIVKLQETLKLNKELESLRQEFMEHKAINDDIETQLKFLKSQIALGKKKVRFPKREKSNKESIILIVANDLIYPVFTWVDGKLEPNHAIVNFKPSKQGDHVLPRPSAGLPVSALSTSFINQIPKSFYLVFAVYDDSFGAFNEAKRLIATSGFDYGWTPRLKGEPVIISPRGKKTDRE
jgi:hypothetical protein